MTETKYSLAGSMFFREFDLVWFRFCMGGDWEWFFTYGGTCHTSEASDITTSKRFPLHHVQTKENVQSTRCDYVVHCAILNWTVDMIFLYLVLKHSSIVGITLLIQLQRTLQL